MATNAPYSNPLGRTAPVIKQIAINALAINAPEIAIFQGDYFDHLVSILSDTAENVHFYIDWQARETFLPVLQQFANGHRIGVARTYRPKGANPAYVDLVFTLNQSALTPITIPAGQRVATNTNVVFETLDPMTFAFGETEKTTRALQRQRITNDPITSTGEANQAYSITGTVVDQAIELQVDGFSWLQGDSFFGAGVDSEVFISRESQSQTYEIVFGDGLNGKIPPIGSTIEYNYYICEGANGNVAQNTINLLQTEVTLPSGYTVSVTNPNNAINGKGYETLEELRIKIPLYTRSIKGASHRSTFPALAQMVNGVANAGVSYDYGAVEETMISTTFISDGTASQIYRLGSVITSKPSSLTVAATTWTQVNSLTGQAANAEVYVLRLNQYLEYEIVFGNGVNGKIPPNTNPIVFNYVGYKLKPVELVAVPDTGGEASDLLLEQVRAYVQNRTELEVRVKSTGVVRVKYEVEVKVTQTTDQTDIQTVVKNTLLAFQSTTNQTVGGLTVFGQAYFALFTALAAFKTIKNDSILITKITLIPYPHRQGATTTKLDWTAEILSTSQEQHRYGIEFTSATTYELSRDTVLLGTYTVGTTFTNTEVSFTIVANGYVAGDNYEFMTYKAPKNIGDTLQLNEPSIALCLSESDITVNTPLA